jgi:Tfp pilus assembly protein PilO
MVGVGLVLVIVLAWFFLLNPVREDISATNAAIEQEQAKLLAAQAKLAQAEVTRKEGKMNQARLMELAKMVPLSGEIPSLLVQIQDLADQAGIEFISITPGSAIVATGFNILPLSLQFTGTFFDLSDFVFRAEQLLAGPGRLLAVKQIDLQLDSKGDAGNGSTSPELRVSMVLYAFEAPDGATPAAATSASNPATSTSVTTSTPSEF